MTDVLTSSQPSKDKRGFPGLLAFLGLIVVLVIAVGLVYLAFRTSQPHPTPIGDILSDLRKYDGQAVTVEGTVTEVINLGGLMKAYQLQDDSGEIMVVTDRGLPNKGDENLVVTGTVKELFNIGGVNMTVIKELQPPS